MRYKKIFFLFLFSVSIISNSSYASAAQVHACNGEWEVQKEATCVSKGRRIWKCRICGKEKNEEIPELGHDYQECCCTRCNNWKFIDRDSKTLFITKSLYHDLGLPLSGDIVVPEEVLLQGEKYKVVGLAPDVFSENKDIVHVTLPDTIKRIGPFAFDFCENLESCNLPDGLEGIGRGAFQCCYKLKEVDFPDSLRWIDDFAYNHCSSLENTTIEIPANVESIGKNPQYPAHMFYDCGTDSFTEFVVKNGNGVYEAYEGILYARNGKTLVSIPRGKSFENHTYVMPDTVENLGELSFSRNKNIHKVVISDNLTIDGCSTVGEKQSYLNLGNELAIACYVYSDVNEYQVKESNQKYTSESGVLYTKNMEKIVAIPNHYKGVLQIPEGVEEWQQEALWTDAVDFTNLIFHQITEIHIPSSVKKIDREQIEVLNFLVDQYGTKITVGINNPIYKIDSYGHIT